MYAVRQVVATRETGEKFDWSKTWVAEMFLSEGERKKRKEVEHVRAAISEIPIEARSANVWDVELEKLRRTTAEIQRSREIKAGVITASVGIGLAIFLYVFMQGIILSGNIAPGAVEILSRLWVVGVLPFCVGLGLLFNGVVVSRRVVLAASQASTKIGALEKATDPQYLQSADTAGLDPPDPPPFSVTDETTRHLRGPDRSEQ